MFHGAVSPWSLHIYHYEAIQGQGPHFLPKKSHNPHPQGERGKGVNMGTLHCGGVGGVPAKPGSYTIYDTSWYLLANDDDDGDDSGEDDDDADDEDDDDDDDDHNDYDGDDADFDDDGNTSNDQWQWQW